MSIEQTIAGLGRFTRTMEEEGWVFDKDKKIWHFVGIVPTIEERLAVLPPFVQDLVDNIGQ